MGICTFVAGKEGMCYLCIRAPAEGWGRRRRPLAAAGDGHTPTPHKTNKPIACVPLKRERRECVTFTVEIAKSVTFVVGTVKRVTFVAGIMKNITFVVITVKRVTFAAEIVKNSTYAVGTI